MRKSILKNPESHTEPDKAKRIYRGVLDVIRRLEGIQKKSKGYRDAFLPEAVALRTRLHAYCERLMFGEPLEYGRKAEELLWRKAYYDVIQLMKRNRKPMRASSSLENAFHTHLVAATGYYQHLLFRLQKEFQLDLEGYIDFYFLTESPQQMCGWSVEDKCILWNAPRSAGTELTQGKEISPEVRTWALNASHRCLIYLGDIARYQQDWETCCSAAISQRYYYQAAALMPDAGMPYNQLGTLAGTRYYNVDAAYYYFRCLSCKSSFEGALGNLNRLFEKNRKRYHELDQQAYRDLPPEEQRSKDIRRFLVRFLYLLDLFYHTNAKLDPAGLQECCQSTLQDLNLVLFYQPPHVLHPDANEEESINDDYSPHLEDHMVLKFVVMAIAVTHHLQKSGSKQMTAAMAFSLAMFSYLLNHVTIRLQSALYELQNPQKLPSVPQTDDVVCASTRPGDNATDVTNCQAVVKPGPTEGLERAENGEKKKLDKQRRLLQRLRRRRRRRKGLSQDDDDSDLSEGGFASGSDSDEVIDYMNGSDLDSSDDDEQLMVSQELRPGFGRSDESRGSLTELGLANGMPEDSGDMPDFSASLLADSNNFLHSTLRWPSLMEGDNTSGADDSHIQSVVLATTDVSVPPGFDKDPEVNHVREISEKLVNFVIETDTEMSSMPTDTDNSSLPTESEVEMTLSDGESTDSIVEQSEEQSQVSALLQVISKEGLLQAVKIYCDWLLCNPNIITTCAQSTAALWTRLSVLLNFLPAESTLGHLDLPWQVQEAVKKAAVHEWSPVYPLQEDRHLQGFAPLRDTQVALEFKPAELPLYSLQTEAILRICTLRRFGYMVDKMEGVEFRYAPPEGCFYGPGMPKEAPQEEVKEQERLAATEARRNQLMKDMAQLRLQAEVSQLEGSLQSHGQPSLPPYLVPDASALCENLHQIKQLAHSARFILTIPLAVIDQLDLLKKDSVGARDAIRWLEVEFRKGNRYVRAQKSHETMTLSQPKGLLKKRDRDAWRFMQIVACCQYLSEQGSECNAKSMVALLTNMNSSNLQLPLRLRQLLVTTRQEGLMMQTPADFFSKWKEVWKAGKG